MPYPDSPTSSMNPSWSSFLEAMRFEHAWSISEFADRCGVSRSTIAVALGATRSVERPRPTIALKIAASLDIPQLAMAIIAGYMDLEVIDHAIDVVNWPVRKLAHATDEWWNRTGGAYLSLCREQNHLSVSDVVHRWNTNWTLPLSEADWTRIEQEGVLPTGANQFPHRDFDHLPGAWLWAITAACTGSTTVYADLVALTFVLGRISQFGRYRRDWVRGLPDYENLVTALTQAMNHARNAVDMAQYRATVLNLSLRIPNVKRDETGGPTDSTNSATSGTASGLDWNTIAAKIANLRKSRGWSEADAAKALKTTSAQWRKWESGYYPIALDVLDRMTQVFETSLTALLSGTERSPRPSEPDSIEARIRRALPLREIPVLGRIVAGIPTDSQPDHRGMTYVTNTIPGDFALEVHGDSMVGAGIQEGDLVIVQRVESWESVPANSMVVALVDGETTLKYLVRESDPIGGDQWYLRAANPAYPDRPINPDQDRVQGRVTSIHTVRPPTLPPTF